MADISDPTVKHFMDSVVRPLSASYLGDYGVATIETNTWNSVIVPILSAYADDDVIIDGAGGTNPQTKADLVAFMVQVSGILSFLNGAGVLPLASKPHINIQLP